MVEREVDRVEAPTRVGVGLIRRGGCFLIRQRPPGAVLAGLWEFPGGKCQPGESSAAATRRECLEETGLEVEVVSTRRVAVHDYPHGRVELYYHDCVTLDPDGEPTAASGFRWVAAAAFPWLSFPEANGPVVEALAREHPAGAELA